MIWFERAETRTKCRKKNLFVPKISTFWTSVYDFVSQKSSSFEMNEIDKNCPLEMMYFVFKLLRAHNERKRFWNYRALQLHGVLNVIKFDCDISELVCVWVRVLIDFAYLTFHRICVQLAPKLMSINIVILKWHWIESIEIASLKRKRMHTYI